MPNIDQVQLPDGSQYNLKDNTSGYVTAGYVDDVIDGLTKANVGLGNVDNTSDLNKPVSTAQQTALNGKTDTTVIAPTEATTTASRRYEIGEQFILNGVLYTATAVIASGDSIIVNTNCDLSDSITGQIKEVNAKFDREYVEVSADGTKTRAQLLNQLFTLIDFSKVRNESYVTFGTSTQYQIYSLYLMSPTTLQFTGGREGTDFSLNTVVLSSGASTFRSLLLTNAIAHTDSSSLVPTVGNIFRLYY